MKMPLCLIKSERLKTTRMGAARIRKNGMSESNGNEGGGVK